MWSCVEHHSQPPRPPILSSAPCSSRLPSTLPESIILTRGRLQWVGDLRYPLPPSSLCSPEHTHPSPHVLLILGRGEVSRWPARGEPPLWFSAPGITSWVLHGVRVRVLWGQALRLPPLPFPSLASAPHHPTPLGPNHAPSLPHCRSDWKGRGF